MEPSHDVTLPKSVSLLEEANLPTILAESIVGRSVPVEVLPEESPATRRVEPDEVPLLIDPDGKYWNDFRPVRVHFTDETGHAWRLPRRWLVGASSSAIPQEESIPLVPEERVFTEMLNLPNAWDLWEINIPWEEANRGEGNETTVEIHHAPNQIPKVFWRDASGALWRIPHDWRRRQIRLPEYEVLASQGIPDQVALDYANRIVSVNYHPGSLCCLPDQYRFRDEDENRWPVFIRDCDPIGYGMSLV